MTNPNRSALEEVPPFSAAEFPGLDWFIYKQDVLNNRIPKDSRALTEPELYFNSLSEAEQLNFTKRSRLFFADNQDMRNKNDRFLRDRFYWEVKT